MPNVFRRVNRFTRPGPPRIVPKSQWYKGRQINPSLQKYRLLVDDAGETRYFTTLESAGSKHFTIPEYTLASGDTVEFTYLAPNSILSGSWQYLFGGDAAGASRAYGALEATSGNFNFSGFGSLELDGVSVGLGSAYPIDGKLHTIKLTSNSSKIIGIIAARYNAASTYSGVLFDFKITRSSDLKRFYKIDETWVGPSTTLVDLGSDAQSGVAVNITFIDAENFAFNGSVSPNTWTNDSETITYEVAGT